LYLILRRRLPLSNTRTCAKCRYLIMRETLGGYNVLLHVALPAQSACKLILRDCLEKLYQRSTENKLVNFPTSVRHTYLRMLYSLHNYPPILIHNGQIRVKTGAVSLNLRTLKAQYDQELWRTGQVEMDVTSIRCR
jgi:hypothetical protein